MSIGPALLDGDGGGWTAASCRIIAPRSMATAQGRRGRTGGTIARTSPPNRAISLTRLELT